MEHEFDPRIELRQEFELKQEPRMEQRIELEQKLEQRLAQQVQLNITLEQYLAQEELIHGFINWADEHNSWINFNKQGFRFRYALLPYDIAEPIADITGSGFAHCFYEPFGDMNPADWCLFVVKDMIPGKFRDVEEIIAIHERGEELSGGNHYFASQLEWAFAKAQQKVNKHIQYIDQEFPGRFIDLTQKVLFPILPDELAEYPDRHKKIKIEELIKAEELIRTNEIPTRVLKLMGRYDNINKKIYRLVTECAAMIAGNFAPRINPEKNEIIKRSYTTEEAAGLINNHLMQTLKSIQPEEARVMSRAMGYDVLAVFEKIVSDSGIDRDVKSHLVFPGDFALAYKKALNNRRLITRNYTTEDIALINKLRINKTKEETGETRGYAMVGV